VEVKHISICPKKCSASWPNKAEAERERRAKVIHADGEFKLRKLAEAAAVIAIQPTAMHLRFLQSLTQVAAENNHTVVLPVPFDLVTSLLNKNREKTES
jgi:hypothetical protein